MSVELLNETFKEIMTYYLDSRHVTVFNYKYFNLQSFKLFTRNVNIAKVTNLGEQAGLAEVRNK